MRTDPSCVFCGVMATGNARWVAQDDRAVAFLPLPGSALAPGHTLVVSRDHCVGVLDASPEALGAVATLVQRVAQAMIGALEATGVVVLNASGPASGQSVDHLHVHVVPRWPDDGAELWPTDRSAHADIPQVHERIASHLTEHVPASEPSPAGES
jgi:histidine triad (HIT) family protein